MPTYLGVEETSSDALKQIASKAVFASIDPEDMKRFGLPRRDILRKAHADALHEVRSAMIAKLGFLHSGGLAYFIEPNLSPLLLDTELNEPVLDYLDMHWAPEHAEGASLVSQD